MKYHKLYISWKLLFTAFLGIGFLGMQSLSAQTVLVGQKLSGTEISAGTEIYYLDPICDPSNNCRILLATAMVPEKGLNRCNASRKGAALP